MKPFSLTDLIDRESRAIAQEMLESRLREFNLPLPKDSSLAIHLDQILATTPQIRETAEARVMAQKDAYSASLRAIGIEPPELPQVLDLEL